jgi:hypothetical protein
VPELTEAFANRSIYFVGDNISLQHYHAFGCQLGADVPTADIPVARALEGSTCTVRRDGTPGRVCHVRASDSSDSRSKNRHSAATVCSRLVSILRAGDVVIAANEGIRHRAGGGDQRLELQSALAMLSPARELRRANALLLWRKTTAQHFPTPTGLYIPSVLSCHGKTRCPVGGCRPVANASRLRERNSAVSQAVRAMGIPVLNAFDRSILHWRSHVERRSASVHTMRGTLDCSHFCEPAELFTKMTAEIISVVKHGGRLPAASKHGARFWMNEESST